MTLRRWATQGLTLLVLVGLTPGKAARAQDSPVVEPTEVKRTKAKDPEEEPEPLPMASEPRPTRHAFQITVQFNETDAFGGLAYRFKAHTRLNLGLSIAYEFRLDNKHTLQQLRPHFYLQREEGRRDLAYLSVDKVQMFSRNIGLFLGLGYGYSGGSYLGTQADAPDAWTPVVDAGAILGFRILTKYALFSRLGYQYADRVSSGDHMASLALGVAL